MNANDLDETQKEILRCLARGDRVKCIATMMGVTNHKIQYNIRLIYAKLDAVSVANAIAKLSGFTI